MMFSKRLDCNNISNYQCLKLTWKQMAVTEWKKVKKKKNSKTKNTVNKLLIFFFFLFQHSKPAISRTASIIAWWTNILIAQLHLRIVVSRLT